ncbi:DUF4178 domain-containing protein [Salibacterium qingdaonense]|uniref:DUF4178 domain-containing protein n=1 Tax=Salibacterium qingdaonense TaxID=266892 RepID=A0A1I4LQ44_9BACI|nr:DUF4178 domain-containing protein [Salibacterium qingdaonense]SFL93228.1 protein of unknown function [Salibacterium qingdaonense]
MGIFNRVKEMFRARNVDEEKGTVTRTIQTMQLEDIVSYDLEDYIVKGKLVYEDGGFEWTVYHLAGETANRWLSFEEDDEWVIGMYDKTSVPPEEPGSGTFEYEGTTYQVKEHGSASIKEAEGRVGASTGQTVEYWDLVDNDTQEKQLSVEKWGGSLEASTGHEISEKEISIIAGT